MKLPGSVTSTPSCSHSALWAAALLPHLAALVPVVLQHEVAQLLIRQWVAQLVKQLVQFHGTCAPTRGAIKAGVTGNKPSVRLHTVLLKTLTYASLVARTGCWVSIHTLHSPMVPLPDLSTALKASS